MQSEIFTFHNFASRTHAHLSRHVPAWGMMTTCSLQTNHCCQQRTAGNALASGLPMEPFRENRPRLLVKTTTWSHTQTLFMSTHLACTWQL